MDYQAELTKYIDRDELVDLASALVRIPSISIEGIYEVEIARFLKNWLEKEGIEAEIRDAAPNRPNVIGYLRSGNGGPSLMYNGHLDMAPLAPGWRKDPYDPWIENGRLYGGAITNMKGQVATMAIALAALKRSGLKLPGDVVLTAVAGECDLLGLGTKYVVESGVRTTYAICSEPSDNVIITAHGGVCQFRIHVHGRAAHVKEREHGINALGGAARVLLNLDEEKLTYEPHEVLSLLPRMTLGMIKGGLLPSVTAPECTITGDIRIVPGMTEESIRKDIELQLACLKDNNPQFDADVEFFVYEAPFVMPLDSPIIKAVIETHTKVKGDPPQVDRSCRMGGTDASHLLANGIPTALYGPGEWGMWPDESIGIEEMVQSALIFALTAFEL